MNIIKETLGIPKELIKSTEKFLSALFGEPVHEISSILGDSVRLIRFKNQLKILSKAREILLKNNLNPQKVSLKLLVPSEMQGLFHMGGSNDRREWVRVRKKIVR